MGLARCSKSSTCPVLSVPEQDNDATATLTKEVAEEVRIKNPDMPEDDVQAEVR